MIFPFRKENYESINTYSPAMHTSLKFKENQCRQRKIKFIIPGGEIVLSNEEGIVISITGLRDGKPFQAS